ncbi:MAG: permease-like cell division protein FtsX [Nocardioides sp.]
MQLRYVFSELRQGLRRNLSMHVAVVLTLFVSLTLVGLGLLLNRQADRTAEQWGSQLEITVWLCKPDDANVACTGEVTAAQRDALVAVIEENPEVAGYRYESAAVAFEKVKELYGEEKFTGPNPAATVDAMPQSYWIELKDPQKFEGIISAIIGLDGVSGVRDMRDTLAPIYQTIRYMTLGALVIAAFLVFAALLLVGNTIRLAAFARRKEIGIMRLVGASGLYIALPFLMEALVTAMISVALAGSTLWAFFHFGITGQLKEKLTFLTWVGTSEFLDVLMAVAVLGPLLTLIPTLVLTGKYLKV